jgi:hypothetical protein
METPDSLVNGAIAITAWYGATLEVGGLAFRLWVASHPASQEINPNRHRPAPLRRVEVVRNPVLVTVNALAMASCLFRALMDPGMNFIL